MFPPFPLDLGYGWKCWVSFACVTLFGRVVWNFFVECEGERMAL